MNNKQHDFIDAKKAGRDRPEGQRNGLPWRTNYCELDEKFDKVGRVLVLWQREEAVGEGELPNALCFEPSIHEQHIHQQQINQQSYYFTVTETDSCTVDGMK
ncbi:Nonribosomal peptide synthase inpB [Dirofilaria immitis]